MVLAVTYLTPPQQASAMGEPYIRYFTMSPAPALQSWTGDWDNATKKVSLTLVGPTNHEAWFAAGVVYRNLGKATATSDGTMTYKVELEKRVWEMQFSEQQYNRVKSDWVKFGCNFTVLNETKIHNDMFGNQIRGFWQEWLWKINVTVTFKSAVQVMIDLSENQTAIEPPAGQPPDEPLLGEPNNGPSQDVAPLVIGIALSVSLTTVAITYLAERRMRKQNGKWKTREEKREATC